MTRQELAAQLDGREYSSVASDIDDKSLGTLAVILGDLFWMTTPKLPHSVFSVVEDGKPFCRGIVVDMAEIGGES